MPVCGACIEARVKIPVLLLSGSRCVVGTLARQVLACLMQNACWQLSS